MHLPAPLMSKKPLGGSRALQLLLCYSMSDPIQGSGTSEPAGAPRQVSPVLPDTHCVRRVKAALVMEVGRLRPLVISRQIFLLMTSTRPPLSVTSWYSVYRSSTCLAMMGMRFTGVPSGGTQETEEGVGDGQRGPFYLGSQLPLSPRCHCRYPQWEVHLSVPR